MSRLRFLQYGLLFPVLLLSGCGFESTKLRVGVLVLIPFLLVMAVLWLLHRRPDKGDEDWQEGRLPDSDDDDNEDHYLM